MLHDFFCTKEEENMHACRIAVPTMLLMFIFQLSGYLKYVHTLTLHPLQPLALGMCEVGGITTRSSNCGLKWGGFPNLRGCSHWLIHRGTPALQEIVGCVVKTQIHKRLLARLVGAHYYSCALIAGLIPGLTGPLTAPAG